MCVGRPKCANLYYGEDTDETQARREGQPGTGAGDRQPHQEVPGVRVALAQWNAGRVRLCITGGYSFHSLVSNLNSTLAASSS